MALELDIDISFESNSELENVLLSDAGILYFIACTYPHHACNNCQVCNKFHLTYSRITVEPVNPDSGKSGHLHITDIKLLSRIFLHLKLVFRHLKNPDTSVFRNQDSHLQSRYIISS